MSSFRVAVPSAVTLTAVFAALWSITHAAQAPYAACVAVIVAALCDMVDGRVARLLDAQTAFGAQLDSLADVVAFGVAPAILAHQWFTPDGGAAALVAPFSFVACSAIRLARFNAGDGAIDAFVGIPTPVSALGLTTLVMASHEVGLPGADHPVVGTVVMLALSALMVVPAQFPSYKRFRSRVAQVFYFGAMAGGVTMLVVGAPGGTLLLALLCFYIVRGLGGAVFGRRSGTG